MLQDTSVTYGQYQQMYKTKTKKKQKSTPALKIERIVMVCELRQVKKSH